MARCLVLGATGYVGSRLVPQLAAAGHEVRCLVRTPAKLQLPDSCRGVDVTVGDVLAPSGLHHAMAGVDVVYYLVHSLAERDFRDVDLRAATQVADAAHAAGVRRIVYLGGLRPEPGDQPSSRHLASRAEVGDVFLNSQVPSAVLQASIIVGSGSTSYELLRHLTERTTVIPAPVWLNNRTQPIAINDVLHYLTGCATLPHRVNRAFDIGGPDLLSYRQMIQRYARAAGLTPRVMVPNPLLSAGMFAQLVELMTPVSAAVAEPLIESLAHELVCTETDINDHIPPPPTGPTSFEQAMRAATVRSMPTPRTPAGEGVPDEDAALPYPGDSVGSGGPAFVEVRGASSTASVQEVWATVCRVGGDSARHLMTTGRPVRGLVNGLVNGVVDGLLGERGRRDDPAVPKVGDVVGRWRVEELDARDHRLVLCAEMRKPGRTWLEMSVGTAEDGSTTYEQRLVFMPSGLFGHMYWLSLLPLNKFLYDVMARNVVLVSQREPTLLTPVVSLFGPVGRQLGRFAAGTA